jgi:hypothetical protein
MTFQVAGEGTRGTIEPEVRQVDANAGLSPRGAACRQLAGWLFLSLAGLDVEQARLAWF